MQFEEDITDLLMRSCVVITTVVVIIIPLLAKMEPGQSTHVCDGPSPPIPQRRPQASATDHINYTLALSNRVGRLTPRVPCAGDQ
jgi:hypothetical protein